MNDFSQKILEKQLQLSHFTRPAGITIEKKPSFNVIPQKPTISKKFDINEILTVGFVIFLIFFLLNCKYGMFKPKDEIPPGY